MSSSKQSKSKISKLAMTIDDLSAGLSLLIRRPFKDIKSVVRHDQRQFSRKSKKHFTVLGLPATIFVGVLSLLAKVFLAPLEVWSTLFQKRKLSRSAFLAMTAFGCLLLSCMAYAGWNYIGNRHVLTVRKQAVAATEAQDYQSAVALFESLQDTKVDLLPKEKFLFAQALARTQRSDEANAILNQLAPSTGRQSGYPPAHRFAAISLVRSEPLPYSAKIQRVLKWHLDAGSQSSESADRGLRALLADDSVAGASPSFVNATETAEESKVDRFVPEFYFAQARYFESTKQYQSAVRPMQIAAQAWPELHLSVASLYQRTGDREHALESLDKARLFLEDCIESKPKDSHSRIRLAQVYLKLAKPELAERQLLLGAEYAPEIFRPQLSRFFLDQWRQLPSGVVVEQRLSLLESAVQYDPENVAAFEAVIRSYRSLEAEDRAMVWQLLDQNVADNPQMPMAHFAKGILYRVDDQPAKAKVEIEAAYKMVDPERPGFAAVANNLAWLLAHNEQPDLDAALKLARMVVDRNPDVGGLRDTLATILMKKGQLETALTEFQKALPTVRDKPAVHLKMAKIYDTLGKPQLATLHRNRAGE